MKHLVDGIKAGFHKEYKVTPITMSAGVRAELPTTPLADRKSITVYNHGTSSESLWLGDDSVSDVDATKSGIPIMGQQYNSADIGRAPLYGITSTDGLIVKVLEVA